MATKKDNEVEVISTEKEKTVIEILSDIQGRLDAPKNRFNSFGKYHYRSAEDILQGLKELLVEHKAAVTLEDEIVLVGDRYYIKATARIWIGEGKFSVSAFARESLDKKGMDGAQVTGSASSYARKYALNGLFAIDDNQDADSQDGNKNQTQVAPTVRNANNTSQRPVTVTQPAPPPVAVDASASLSPQGWAAINSLLEKLEYKADNYSTQVVITLRKLGLEVPTLMADIPKSSGMAVYEALKKELETKEAFLSEPEP